MAYNNILDGFNMVASISESTINYQFGQLFKHGFIPSTIDLKIGDDPDDPEIEMSATLTAPTVSFSVFDNPRSISFILNMKEGVLKYWKGGHHPTPESIPFTDWQYAFEVNLDMQQINQQSIENHEKIPPVVKGILKSFTDDMFSIQSLFMDFQNADLAKLDAKHTKTGTSTDPMAVMNLDAAIRTYFKNLKGSDNPYILGYSINAHSSSGHASHSTFVPTGATFSIFKHPTDDSLNALNFLVMTDNNEMPTDKNAGKFTNNWIQPEHNGRFIIAGDLFMDHWFLPTIEKGLDYIGDNWPSISVKGKVERNEVTEGWKFKRVDSHKMKAHSDLPCKVSGKSADIAQETVFTVEAWLRKTSGTEFELSGTIVMYLRLEWSGGDCWDSSVAKAWWTCPWKVKLSITTGKKGEVQVQKEVSHEKIKFKWKCFNLNMTKKWMEGKDGGWDPGTRLEKSINETFPLDNVFRETHSNFVLPAGHVFFFQNPLIDENGNLFTDINYKSPH